MKDDRLQLRVDATSKRRLEEAAAEAHLSVSAFVLQAASQAVLKSPMSRKHVLVISDGMNNSGPDPASVLPQLQQQAAGLGTALAPHFIAFDVSASVFNLLKRQGITVVEAGDETQLNRQLEFILEDKILLEKEESRKTKLCPCSFKLANRIV